jgi:hypothetical protein
VAEYSYYKLTTIPSVLDIVWCLFPIAELPNKPGPKSRPGLVRSLKVNTSQTKALVEVTYGTTKMSILDRSHRGDLIIANVSEIEKSGLPRGTRFAIGRTLWLPWAKEFFAPKDEGGSIVIGHLPSQSQMQLQALSVRRRDRGF